MRTLSLWASINVLQLLVKGFASLECYICGESNAEEFGECESQFPYDCSSYASHFGENERIYCRTTRQKTNNKYLIMKECIGQTDHYKTFPRKDYPLDEECDLIDIMGSEVAYCLCRSNDLCNGHSLADQFVAFEELHPELFEDEQDEIEEKNISSLDQDEINAESDTRRHPSLPRQVVDDASTEKISRYFDESHQTADTKFLLPEKLNEEQYQRQSHQHITNSLSKLFPTNNTHSITNDIIPHYKEILKCFYCESEVLQNGTYDCIRSMVKNCQFNQKEEADISFCFTKQIFWDTGLSTIEKGCKSLKQLMQEYQGNIPFNACMRDVNNTENICLCATHECNRSPINVQFLSLAEEMGGADMLNLGARISEPKSSMQVAVKCFECLEENLQEPIFDCIHQTQQICLENDMFCMTRHSKLVNGHYELKKGCMSEKLFKQKYPREGLEVGCTSSSDDFTMSCICFENFCNKHSISIQSEMFGNDANYDATTPVSTLPIPYHPETTIAPIERNDGSTDKRQYDHRQEMNRVSTTAQSKALFEYLDHTRKWKDSYIHDITAFMDTADDSRYSGNACSRRYSFLFIAFLVVLMKY